MNQGQFLGESQQDSDEEAIFHPAIGFDGFYQYCMDQLEEVYIKKFKKSQMFTDMLMDICRTEATIRLHAMLKLIPSRSNSTTSQI